MNDEPSIRIKPVAAPEPAEGHRADLRRRGDPAAAAHAVQSAPHARSADAGPEARFVRGRAPARRRVALGCDGPARRHDPGHQVPARGNVFLAGLAGAQGGRRARTGSLPPLRGFALVLRQRHGRQRVRPQRTRRLPQAGGLPDVRRQLSLRGAAHPLAAAAGRLGARGRRPTGAGVDGRGRVRAAVVFREHDGLAALFAHRRLRGQRQPARLGERASG